MRDNGVCEAELPGRIVDVDTLRVIVHRHCWVAGLVSGKLVLEVGCGPGLGLRLLEQTASRVIAGDLLEKNLSLARQYHPSARLVRFDAHNLPFPNGCLDAVVAVAVLIYCDATTLFRECRRVLRPGGMLLLNMPNKDRPGFKPSRLSRAYHSVPDLYGILTAHGFDVKIFGSFRVAPRRAVLERVVAAGKTALRRALQFTGTYEKVKRTIDKGSLVALGPALTASDVARVRDVTMVPLSPLAIDKEYRIISVVGHAR